MVTLMRAFLAVAVGLTCLAQAAQPPSSSGSAGGTDAKSRRALEVAAQTWAGDFDEMLERRTVRVLAPFSRTLFYIDKGRERGITAELARDFEKYLNAKYAKQLGKRPITVVLIVTTRDKLLTNLAAGLGDVAAGNLTVTPERAAIADFVAPEDRAAVNEVLVTGPASASVASVEALSGRTVHVRRASSYYESLVALNSRLSAAGKAPVKITVVPEALEDEDLMEMANAGLVEALVVDDWKARIWAQILPKVTVHNDVVLRSGGRTGWAIRKGSPKLAAEIDEFYRTVAQRQHLIDVRLAQSMKRVKQIRNATADAEYKRFQDTIALFRKYGDQYRFDPLMLAAQGFQESGLDQNAKSAVGAIGIMQIMPQTGAELKVGDIRVTEANVHGGAKYLDKLMSTAFPDAHFDDVNRTLFAFASYNCGPGNVAKARTEARRRGLDPDRWFNNVEIVIAEKIGMETTTYVRNIYKYYAAYRLVAEARAAVEKARTGITPPGK